MKKNSKKLAFKPWGLVLLVLVLVALGGGVAYKTFHKTTVIIPSSKTVATPASTNTTPKAPDSSTTPPKTSSTPDPTDSSKTTTSGSSQPPSQTSELIAPYGSFVSNHGPSAGDKELSVCTTSAGATCYIEFISGNTTKKLEAQTVSSEGSAYWNWDASLLGSGTWTVKAVASLNGQTKTTQDQQSMEVK